MCMVGGRGFLCGTALLVAVGLTDANRSNDAVMFECVHVCVSVSEQEPVRMV